MSRGQQYTDKKEKYSNTSQSKNLGLGQQKHGLDKWPLGYRKVTTSTGMTA